MPREFGFTSGEDRREEEELHWTDPSLQTPWTDPGAPLPFTEQAWFDDPFIKEGKSWLSPRELYSRPFTEEEFKEGRAQFGQSFQDAPPLTQYRYQKFSEEGFPGFGGEVFGRGTFPMQVPKPEDIPSWMSNLYSLGEGETLSSLVSRAQAGVSNWLSGGANAPRLLTLKEWEEMLPSEREGLLGFLEYVGIPPDDYTFMLQRQQQEVAEAFGLPVQAARPFSVNYVAARQR